MPILEKGVAKVFGNYANLNAGNTAEALIFLTGYPVFGGIRGQR